MKTIVVPLLIASVASLAIARQEAGTEEQDPGIAAVEALKTKFDDAQNAFIEKYKAASTDEERQKLFQSEYPRASEYAPRFLEIAKEYSGKPAAREALLWIVQTAEGADGMLRDALSTLSTDFIQDEKLADVCASLRYQSSGEAEDFLRKVYAESPHHAVKGNAAYNLAHVITAQAASEEGEDAASMRKDAKVLFEEVVKSFSDVKTRRGSLGDAAAGDIFEIEHLAVGSEAPDIEGEDLDGVEFKLSDYRGQVVVLDFWGDW